MLIPLPLLPSPPLPSPSPLQQRDLFSLGQLLLCVSLQSADVGRPENLHRSLEVVANTYSPELNHVLQYVTCDPSFPL